MNTRKLSAYQTFKMENLHACRIEGVRTIKLANVQARKLSSRQLWDCDGAHDWAYSGVQSCARSDAHIGARARVHRGARDGAQNFTSSKGHEMTKTILIATQKGGAGKTTIATNLAGTLSGNVALFDIDPQRTTANVWGGSRARNGRELPTVFGTPFEELRAYIARAKEVGFDWIVVDTIPASNEAITEAARYADMIILPSKPNVGDIHALRTTLELLARFQVPKYVVLNEVTWSGRWIGKLDKPRAAVVSIGGTLADPYLGSRRCYPDAMEFGLTVPEFAPRNQGAAEVLSLAEFVTAKAA